MGADKSIIDALLGRKSLGARAVAEGVILCTGASYHMSIDKVVADTAHVYRLMNLPKAETMPPEMEESLEKCLKDHGEALICRGADGYHGDATAALRRAAEYPAGGEGSQQGAAEQ